MTVPSATMRLSFRLHPRMCGRGKSGDRDFRARRPLEKGGTPRRGAGTAGAGRVRSTGLPRPARIDRKTQSLSPDPIQPKGPSAASPPSRPVPDPPARARAGPRGGRRGSQIRPGLVQLGRGEVPEPAFVRLEATDHRMPGGVEVGSGVLGRRVVAAADVPALSAPPQMEHQPPASLHSTQPLPLGGTPGSIPFTVLILPPVTIREPAGDRRSARRRRTPRRSVAAAPGTVCRPAPTGRPGCRGACWR